MIKRNHHLFVLLIGAILCMESTSCLYGATPFPNAVRTKKIFAQEKLIKEGTNLVEMGRYDEAIAKYKEATRAELLLHDYDEDRPSLLMAKALEFQSKYEEALLVIKNVLKKYPDRKGFDLNWDGKILELDALIKARETHSRTPIYNHINFLERENKNLLPPQTCIGWCDVIFTTICRLYDHIGDSDGGISFANGFIDYYAKKAGSTSGKIESKNQYFIIKQAFEQDKAEGFKGCVDAKLGEACMGRATKALIQSDYFPW